MDEKKLVRVYYGEGKGKTTAALGLALKEAAVGNTTTVIQCLKNKNDVEMSFLQRLEPEIKLFRFEKSEGYYEDLSAEEQVEERNNLRNALNFARKVLSTGSCELLILDEALGLLDNGIISIDELKELIDLKSDDTGLIITGRTFPEDLLDLVDEVYRIETVKA